MALGNLLGGLLVGGAKAASAYATAAKKKTPTTTTKAPVQQAQPTTNEHYNYIDSGIGMDAYKTIQQNKYNKAIDAGDSDMLTRLNADMKKVGYNLDTSYQSPVQVNPFADQLQANQAKYDALLKDYKNVMNASVNKGTQNLESQKGSINQSADDMARQAYILSRQNAKDLPQQLASQGITGGGTETAQLGLMSNYENNLNSINTNRSNALNAVDTSINDLRNQGELSYAEQTLSNNQAALNAYQNMLSQSANYGQWQSEVNYGKDRDNINDQRYTSETATAQQQQEYNNILNRLSMGLISANDAVALGVPQSDVQAYTNRINAMSDMELKAMQADLANQQSITAKRNAGSTSSSSSSSSTSNSGVLGTANKYLAQGNREKAISALASIYDSAQIKSYLEQNGYKTDDIDWGIEETQATNFTPSQPASPTNMLIQYLSGKGLTSQQIAAQLNK